MSLPYGKTILANQLLTSDGEDWHIKMGNMDFFGADNRAGFDIGSDVFEVVLALAPVPDPVFGEGPGIDLEEEGIEIWHKDLLGGFPIYVWISLRPTILS